ncbi:MAG: hypothetical protein ACKERG_00845 [Candidatus Hodgkinia cicadicola]
MNCVANWVDLNVDWKAARLRFSASICKSSRTLVLLWALYCFGKSLNCFLRSNFALLKCKLKAKISNIKK